LLEKLKKIAYSKGNTMAKVISTRLPRFTREIIKLNSNKKKI